MLKFNQIDFIYTEVCCKGLKNIRDVNHQQLEYILFLMQYHSLQDRERPLYKYKTYIYNGAVHIPQYELFVTSHAFTCNRIYWIFY
jgi:hypothetical protein